MAVRDEVRTCRCGCGETLSPNKRGGFSTFKKNHDKRLRGPLFVEEDRGYKTPCWIWQGHVNKTGYGSASICGRTITAHRRAWMLAHGEIPKGLYVLHHCDVKACINPAHLFLGTQADNMTDKVKKNRQAKGITHGRRTKPERTPRGEHNGASRLTEESVRRIKRLLKTGGNTYTEIGKQFNISRHTVGLIAADKRWRHVDA